MSKKIYAGRYMPEGYSDEVERKVQSFRKQNIKVAPRHIIKTHAQIEAIKESAKINTALLDFLSENIKEGISTHDLNEMAHKFTIDAGAIPAPLNYEGFPKSICTSINEVVCHGIPNKKDILRNGDIINIDVSTIYKGYFSDASRMFMIGEVNPEKKRLVEVTKECLLIGIEKAKPWARLGDIGAAIQNHAEKNGYTIVRELCGHGVGLKFHEDPEVNHYGKAGTGMMLVPGMIFTIEPMVNMGKRNIFIDEDDEWTVITEDGMPSAQWEHMILITETGNEILSW